MKNLKRCKFNSYLDDIDRQADEMYSQLGIQMQSLST